MMSRTILIFLILALLSSCTKTAKKEGSASIEDRSTSIMTSAGVEPPGDGESNTQSYGAGAQEGALFQPLGELKNKSSTRPLEQLIYFTYDSARVDPEYRTMIENHANYLAANPDLRITLEGHADERGSREYNLALGEYRAQAVRRYMVLLGVSSDRIRTTSYGEERPAVDGHDESVWSQNRRVEIRY